MQLITKNLYYKKAITVWLILLTILVLLLIIIGGLTRLTDSGLSIVDWKPILGIIPPLNHQSWITVFEQYKLSPEYKIYNFSMSLNDFKYIYWWEWFHRFLARFLGIVFIFPLLFFLFKKNISKKLMIILFILLSLGMLQAIVGWWMVKSGLVNNPNVSSYRLTFHLSIALVIFCIFFWLSLLMIYNPRKKNNNPLFIINLFHFSLFLVLLTIISGAFMAGSDAGKAFNTYPWMDGKFIPNDYYLIEYGFLNIFENIIAINFNHRWLGTFTFIFLLIIIFYMLKTTKYKFHKISLLIVLFFISLQFLLGVLTLLYGVPIIAASFHQTNAILLLGSLLFSYYKLIY